MQVIQPYRLLSMVTTGVVIIIIVLVLTGAKKNDGNKDVISSRAKTDTTWIAPHPSQIPSTPEGSLIQYGRELIANTAFYLGPHGRVAAITNGMNCQNCHLEAGTKVLGNNYSGVFSTYPKFRARSGGLETIYKRINDCIERSLAGKKTLDTNSREMQAIYAYMKWLGEDVPKNTRPAGAGLNELAFLERAADPAKGRVVYQQNCKRCHGPEGEGILNADKSAFVYPPLWGERSYTTAAGLFRISRLAGYVRNNMPFDAPHNVPLLTDEQAWDVAAFVNSQPRPVKVFKEDWPDIAGKPIDHPFGPYIDSFTETQHKYGPFGPIREAAEKRKKGRSGGQ